MLATYSYYPYNYGGTEVYVSGLAGYLKQEGHQVTIIAGMPSRAFEEHSIFYEDEQLKTIRYLQNEIPVIGVVLKNESTTEIYRKYRESWNISWYQVFEKENASTYDVLHLHANTSPVGESLIKALKLHSPKIKCVATYHLPISCVKGTLLFGGKMIDCTIRPAVNICTACVLATKQQWPLSFAKAVVSLMPLISNEKAPTGLRLKFLVKEFISSFKSLNRLIDRWHVFSTQVFHILIANEIQKEKIEIMQHGVDPSFFLTEEAVIVERKKSEQIIFFYAGRFDRVKGFLTLLKAWNSLVPTSNRILLIAGESQSADEELLGLIKSSSIRPDISFIGAVTHENVAGYMKKVHCTIIPSEWVEIGPLVFHEAIAAGSDVIASDIGGCGELANTYRGKSSCFEAGNELSLKKSIQTFKYSGVQLKVATDLQNYSSVLKSYSDLVTN